jgi:uncharacterized Fe-S cluster-containing radical SAM superfamily protein
MAHPTQQALRLACVDTDALSQEATIEIVKEAEKALATVSCPAARRHILRLARVARFYQGRIHFTADQVGCGWTEAATSGVSA